MNFGTLVIFSVVCYIAAAAYVPTGFIPLPPLPVNQKPPKTPKPAVTQPTKKPVTTKAPFKATTQKPTPPPTPAPTTTSSALPPSSTLAPSQSTNCGLNVNVPGSNCNTGSGVNNAVQQSLATLKQELAKARQQHQAQNAAVQSMISQLQTRQVGYLNKISDLQNEVANLVRAFNALSVGNKPSSTLAPSSVASAAPPSGISSLVLQQALQSVRQDMNKATTDFNLRIFNLSAILHSNEQQEITVHQNIESQIQKQASEIGHLSQQVIDLGNLLKLLNATSSSGTGNSGASAADIAKLQAQVNKVESDIKAYDQKQQGQFTSLNAKTASLLGDVSNHTTELRILRTNLMLDQSRLRNVEKNVTVVHDALANFRQQTMPKMRQMETDINDLKQNVTGIQSSVKRIDKSVLNFVLQIGTDEQQLNGVKAQATQLRTDVSTIQGDLNKQTSEITGIRNGMLNLKNAIPVSELNTMNNIILQALNNPNQALNATQLQNLKQAITTITNKLSQLNPPNSSG